MYYLPKPIPRQLELSSTGVASLSEADAAVGHPQGLGMLITDPSLLIGPYLRREALARSRRLVSIRESYHSEAIKERSSLPRLVDIIVRNPFVTVKSVQDQLELTNQGSRNLIKNAEARGWLRSLGTHGRGGRERWYSPAIFEVIEAPMSYAAE